MEHGQPVLKAKKMHTRLATLPSRQAAEHQRGGGVAGCGRFLEGDVDAAAGGVFDGLLGLVVEIVVPQAAAGTPHGGGVGHTGAGARATHPFERRTWPQSTRRTMEGRIDCGWVSELGRVYVCLRAGLDSGRTKEGGARERDQGRNVFAF